MLRANLGTDRTARTQDRIDFNPVILNEKSRACQLIDAVSVVFTFFTDKKRSSTGFLQRLGKQRAGLL